MHGRVKVRTTAEQEALKKVERTKKLAQYKAGIAIVFQKRSEKTWDNELLSITEQMLLRNPDIYTLWNIRREAFENNDWSDEEYAKILEKELTLTENCLRENPKSYTIWHQRCWVIDCMREPDWKRELSLCAKCLNLDERNFHCWDYRQYIVEKAKIPNIEEFDFSTQKILSNFSNYSSWHYRSKILMKMFDSDNSAELMSMRQKQNAELKLVMNATFTDPNDSSAWFYQRWLLDNCDSHPVLWLARTTKNNIVLVFSKEVFIESLVVLLYIDDKKIDMQWKSHKEKKFSKIWTGYFVEQLENLDAAKDVYVKIQNNLYSFQNLNTDSIWHFETSEILHKNYHDEEQLIEQLKSYKELAIMEPNNKWALLTGVFLMKKINFVQYHEDILKDLNSLLTVDPLRSNYYKDLRSKYVLEYMLYKLWQDRNRSIVHSKIDLSGLDLTMFYNNQYFAFSQEIDFDSNQLGNSLHQLSTLQQCTNLNLSGNRLKSLKRFPTLTNLKVLSLQNNELTNLDEILDLVKRHNLTSLDLRQNPLCKVDSDITLQIKNISLDLEVYV